MISIRVFRTESIDLAAFLSTAGHELTISCAPDSCRALFQFIETEALHQAIVSFESGAQQPAKRLLNIRSRLYREASQVVRGGACL